MQNVNENLVKDVEIIQQLESIPNLLEVICKTTDMGFAAVARVTEHRWTACGVRDEINFGLLPGGELEINSTICHEIEQSRKGVIIDHVDADPNWKNHPTPLQYGFQSYISFPIILPDGSFFGTLCAIDPKPNSLTRPEVVNLFKLFANLIAFELDTCYKKEHLVASIEAEKLISYEKELQVLNFNNEVKHKVEEKTRELSSKNNELERINSELQSFAYASSHDLQEPLRKIQTFAGLLIDRESGKLSENGKEYCRKMQNAATRMQNLINDLLSYSKTSMDHVGLVPTDLNIVISEVEHELADALHAINGSITSENLATLDLIPYQIMQLFYNLLNNSIKFHNPDRQLKILVTGEKIKGHKTGVANLDTEEDYYHLSIKDNGIGFDQKYSDKIFELFQRLHTRTDYEGTGIGLSIVKKIVENHKGFISASSVKNEGAKFDIYFPA